MKPLVRTLGVALLAAALMNASAGLCFCHRGPALPGAPASSPSCCHGPDASGTAVVKAISTCCQIESADSVATPAPAVPLAPPAAVVTPVSLAASARESLPLVAAALASSSPPIFALRI
ncbi:MAG: hypothetical protein MUE61_15435 [Vicinamibacterales bacterium]|nr:hypothetical protein [Vicinamibacterales bacterium]